MSLQSEEEYKRRKELVRFYLGKTVTVKMDRPVGTVHEKNGNRWVYPINYGYIPGVIGGDGEELDVYLLRVKEPLETCDVKIAAIVHRTDDEEDKLVGIPVGEPFPTRQEVFDGVYFQERYHESYIELAKEE